MYPALNIFFLILNLVSAQMPATPPPPPAEMVEKAKHFCRLIENCNRAHPGKSALCVKTNLKESGLLDHTLDGEQAKDLPRFLRREGYVDIELTTRKFEMVPEGAMLVLDAQDPLKTHTSSCPKVYGNVYVKCDGKWIDDQKYELDFHMQRGCRTKGIWIDPVLIPPPPPPKDFSKRPVTPN